MTQTILVVDDDLELRKLVQSYLIEEGFRAVTAANGREAIGSNDAGNGRV